MTYQEQASNPGNRIDDLDVNPHSYAHLIFDKGAKNI
jgi:hypothetical protein